MNGFAFSYGHPGGAYVVLIHDKKQAQWLPGTHPAPFTCPITGLEYYADGPCWTCADYPGVVLSGEGVYKLKTKGFAFLD